MITFIMNHTMLRAIFQIFFKIPNLFAALVNISPSVVQKRFLDKEEGRKYKIIKCYFAPKLPSICINQKCSMEVGYLILCSLFNSLFIEPKRGSRGEPPSFGDFVNISLN